jgi:DNA-binding SARP family transcriptional activator
MFGPFSASVHGAPLPRLRTQKGCSLLALLVLRKGRAVNREWIAGTLWPESAQAQAFYNLRRSLSDLRHALGRQADRVTSPTAQTVSFDSAGADIDVLAFDAALAERTTPALKNAIALYTGPFLEGMLDEWIIPERQQREIVYLDALEELAARLTAEGDALASGSLWRRAIAIDPTRESAHRGLMSALAQAGNIMAAQQVFRDLRLRLLRDYNAEPSPDTLELYRAIRTRLQQSRGVAMPAVRANQAPAPDGPAEAPTPRMGGAGGAVTPDSPIYVVRDADHTLGAAVQDGESIVLAKGPHQVGKTSLLARGAEIARREGMRVAISDCSKLEEGQLQTAESTYRTFARQITSQLELSDLSSLWHPDAGSSENLEQFLRCGVLLPDAPPFVWMIDEVDRLFGCPFTNDLFALFRAWHNERALAPDTRWSALTIVIAYATEVHLIIDDLNQSPFNVGVRVELGDFTLDQVAELTRVYGISKHEADERHLYRLLGGHPYLVRCALDAMQAGSASLDELEAAALRDEGPLAGHLRRLLNLLRRDRQLTEAVRSILNGRPRLSQETFYRLRSAGVVMGAGAGDCRLRCRLYESYLKCFLE